MEPKNEDLEDEFPSQMGKCSGSNHQYSRGVQSKQPQTSEVFFLFNLDEQHLLVGDTHLPNLEDHPTY